MTNEFKTDPAASSGSATHRISLPVAQLTKSAFAPYGQVIEAEGADPRIINAGFAHRFHDLISVDTATEGGRTAVSIFHAFRRPFPIVIEMLERHPLASQAFYPLSDEPWLVVVALGESTPDLETVSCFLASGTQGVNYARNIWHYPVLTLSKTQNFIVIDREGAGSNLDEQAIPELVIAFDLPSD